MRTCAIIAGGLALTSYAILLWPKTWPGRQSVSAVLLLVAAGLVVAGAIIGSLE